MNEYSNDEDNLCSLKYEDFKRNSMYFSKRTIAKERKKSLPRLAVSTNEDTSIK